MAALHLFSLIVILTGIVPLAQAWWANRRTSLLQAVHWAITAWAAWVWVLGTSLAVPREQDASRYLALCLTGCAGVAVLGARRPHVGAWNFVVLGLFVVLLWPLVEGWALGVQSLGALRLAFVSATVAVGLLNYLPTCSGLAAVLLALGCGGTVAAIGLGPAEERWALVLDLAPALAPWLAWWGWRRRRQGESQFDRLWLDFRDRYGLIWAQRTRDQFNAAARHAGWPAQLYWQGLFLKRGLAEPTAAQREEMLETLRGLLKRFHSEDAGR